MHHLARQDPKLGCLACEGQPGKKAVSAWVHSACSANGNAGRWQQNPHDPTAEDPPPTCRNCGGVGAVGKQQHSGEAKCPARKYYKPGLAIPETYNWALWTTDIAQLSVALGHA